MASIFDILAEQRISDAIKRGELDDLPGAGRPLVFDDDPFVSPEQRMTNRILKNAGFVPQEVLLRREIASLRQQLTTAESDEEERERVRRRLGFLIATLGSLRRR
jgi:DnaJ-like protein